MRCVAGTLAAETDAAIALDELAANADNEDDEFESPALFFGGGGANATAQKVGEPIAGLLQKLEAILAAKNDTFQSADCYADEEALTELAKAVATAVPKCDVATEASNASCVLDAWQQVLQIQCGPEAALSQRSCQQLWRFYLLAQQKRYEAHEKPDFGDSDASDESGSAGESEKTEEASCENVSNQDPQELQQDDKQNEKTAGEDIIGRNVEKAAPGTRSMPQRRGASGEVHGNDVAGEGPETNITADAKCTDHDDIGADQLGPLYKPV
jgi:hypothetical protein